MIRVASLAGGIAMALGVGLSSANAATLSVVGGAASVIPASMSLVGRAAYDAAQGGVGDIGDSLTIFSQASKNATNGLFVDELVDVTFTYLGSEAGFSNSAVVDGVDFVNNKADLPGAMSMTFQTGAGFLPFSFISNGADAIANNGGANASVRLGFSSVFNGGASVLAYFDDNTPDMDFDDLVVRIDVVSPIPLPPSVTLLGAALLGVSLLGRRRRSRA